MEKEKKEKPRKASGWDRTVVSFSPGQLRPLALDGMGEGAGSEEKARVFKVRLGRSEETLASASDLLGRRYVWRGFPKVELARWERCMTIMATLEDKVAGTLTVGRDAGAGLMADVSYREELDALRKEGRSLGELSKFAVDEDLGSKELLASLLHVAYIYGGLIGGCTDAVIEILPRHKSFYERMLGFSQIGEERMNHRVHFPVILMRLDLEILRMRVKDVGGQGKSANGRTLYPYFFSPKDERGIEERIRRELAKSDPSR